MAGIGDSWGTAQELMHPRDSHGRFRTKWKMSPSVLAAVEKVLQAFRPRTFQSDGQAAQYNFNLASRKPGRFGGGKGFARLQADYHAANEDLRDGNIDEPSTRKFVDMMDQAATDLPDDIIASRVVGPDAFGLTPEQLPQLEEMTGNVIADRGYGAANIGTPVGGGQGLITMVMATPKGTRMIVPGRNRNDRALFYDRDQEFTVTKVKPDGRGGYTMYAVATPKTAGATPAPENVGHQGPGTSHNREAAVKALENASAKRDMGNQAPGQAPPGASGAVPQTGTPEEQRAARRAQVLGRPAGPNATPQAQQEAAAPPAPAPSAPAVPSAPAPTPAAPESNVPSGVTSVVTGEPATSFREVAKGLESPSAGPRRREWNSAYQGIVSGKQHPQDMLRELEADIANNKEIQKTEPGLGDSVLAHDIEKQEKLADLIRSHFNLGEPVQRQPRQEVRNELQAKAAKAAKAALLRPGGGTEKTPPGKKSAVEAARPAPLAKVAPKRAGTPQERAKALGAQREQDLKDNQLNAEQRSRWADQVGKEPASLTPDNASSILLDETADQLRNGRTTRAKAVDRLREQARDQNTPEADYLRKVADVIEADTSKPAKRVPLKKAAPKAPPNVEAAEASLAGRSDKNILTGLNKLSVGDMRAVAEKWGIQTRGEDKKLKLKAVLAKELAAHWKATPELQRKKEGGVPGAPSVPEAPVKKAAKAATKAAVKEAPPDLAPEDLKTFDRLQAEGVPREKAIDQAINAVAAKKTTPRAKALTKIAESPDVPEVVKKAAKKAAAKKAPTELTKAQRDANLPELSRRVLAGESANAVVNDIRARHGLPPEAPAQVTGPPILGPDEILARLNNFENPPSREQSHEMLKGLKKSILVDMARKESIPSPTSKNMQQLRDEIVQATSGRRLNSIATRGFKGENPFSPELPAPEAAKIPGIDTAERARLQARAKEVLAEMQNKPAADPFDEMSKALGDTEVSRDLVARAKKIRDEVQATSGPPGISVEDRVAARMLASIKPEHRDGVLAEMDPKERAHLLDVAARIAAEDVRVKKSGHSLDRILSDAGLKAPTDQDSQPVYEEVKRLLADNNIRGANYALKDELRRVDLGLESYRRTAGNVNAPEKQRQYAGEQITKLLARSEWLRSVAGALHGGSVTSPELTTKKEVKEVIGVHSPELQKISVENLKGAAKAAGIKLPEGATTKDEILTELAREMIRRDKAGDPIQFPAPKLTTRPTPKPVESHRIEARSLVQGEAWDESNANLPGGAPSDKAMLDRIQGLLDGNPEDIAAAGLGKGTPTPVAIGRYLDGWANGPGGPAARLAMTVIGTDRIKDDLKQKLAPDEEKRLRDRLSEIEKERGQLRAQHDRWKALADRLKKTRRTPVSKKAAAQQQVDEQVARNMEVLSRGGMRNETPPIKETLARAAKSTPAAPAPRRVTKTNLELSSDEEVQKYLQEGRISPATAKKEFQRRADEMRSLAARGEVGASMGGSVTGERSLKIKSPRGLADHQRRLDEAARLDKLANKVETKPAAPAKAAAPTVEQQVAKRAVRKEVQAEVAKKTAPKKAVQENLSGLTNEELRKITESSAFSEAGKATVAKELERRMAAEAAPVKKAAKKAAPTVSESPGGKKYTEAELQDMNLGDLVDIENERGIKRVSVAKADRIQAILDQQNVAPTPEPKKVTAKASKAAAAKIEAAPPSKAAPTKIPSSKIQAGKYSSAPVEPNSWGGFTPTPVHYHNDGIIGQAVKSLGPDAALDVNGDRLDNVIGRIATDTVLGRTSQQEMIDKLGKLASELPAGSNAQKALQNAVEQMDTPKRSIDVPEGTPPPLTELARELAGIPLARTDKNGQDGSSELTRLANILADYKAGKLGPARLRTEISNLANLRHESMEGKFEIDRAIKEAVAALKKFTEAERKARGGS
jgi:hypothetical protein